MTRGDPWDWLWWFLPMIVVGVIFWLIFPRVFGQSMKKWENLYERQNELLSQQLEVMRQVNELLKKLTGSR